MDFNEIKKCNDEHKIYIGTDWGLDNHSIDALRYCYDDLIMTKDAHNMYCLGLWEKEKKKKKENEKPKIEKVIFNEPATIVLWSDGTKTVVKCQEEEFDKEKGLAMAIAKRFLRTNTTGSNYYNEFKKWIPKETETVDLQFINNRRTTWQKELKDVISDAVHDMAQQFRIPSDKLIKSDKYIDTKRED